VGGRELDLQKQQPDFGQGRTKLGEEKSRTITLNL